MKLNVILAAVGVASSVLVGCAANPGVAGEQRPAKVAATQPTLTYDYLLYLPADFNADKTAKWPLVVFLHGAGERGSDVNKVAANGPPKQAAQGRDFPFVLVSPQCPENQWWDVDTLQVMLDKILKEQGDRIDRDRIYVTGLSMGGGGSWEWISRDPNPFAAAVIVCGAASRVPMRIKDPIPVWAIHGTNDDIVPPWITTLLVDQWQQAGGETRVSMYEGVNHGSWDRAYDEPDLWTWLLSHKKQPRTEGRAKFVMPRTPTTQPAEPKW
jgi:predicted peptidase